MEEVYREFLGHGKVNNRAFNSAFALSVEAMSYLFETYGQTFANLKEFCMFVNYTTDYPKSDDLFAHHWNTSRQTFKPKLIQNLCWLHSNIKEVEFSSFITKLLDSLE